MKSTYLQALCLAIVSLTPIAAFADDDPPQVAIGERLFLETRFAQYFEAHCGGNINAPLATGDPAMDDTVTTGTSQPGPFAGQSMNCRACHLVDEQNAALGNRTYNDFARRSPIPARIEDNLTETPRNSPPLVNASMPRSIFALHFDAEFPSKKDLVIGTLTGRNYGWLAGEEARARAHVAQVIREDDGSGALAQQYGGSYRDVFAANANVPAEFRLPKAYRLNVDKATDTQILNLIGNLMGAYMQSLTFSRDSHGIYNGSPYDAFLAKNKLPRKPAAGESAIAYGARLLRALNALQSPQFISNADGSFQVHTNQSFTFGATELAGLKIFLRRPVRPNGPLSQAEINQGAIGNCVACHAPPNFTDFKFHNVGATQEEYDSIHGSGAFSALRIPSLAERQADPDAYLPASAKHPFAEGRFRAVPSAQEPQLTDLGLWNIFANPDHPLSQPSILRALTGGRPATKAALLPKTIALFKTPGLRDLADSGPYLHTGRKDTLVDVVDLYRTNSSLQRAGALRNGATELSAMSILPTDEAPLAAFLTSLTEDYE